MKRTTRKPMTAVAVVGTMMAGVLSLALTQTDNLPQSSHSQSVTRP